MAGLIDYRMGSATKTKESKRQQARNERALQDLIKGIPGNDSCAECGAKNPAWASWSLGVFLCMRCAAIHRKLGTHISKVKSLSMDSWTAEQVETMKRNGNTASNRKYNPRNKKPPITIDADEADSAMERFVREKYANVEPLPPKDSRVTNDRPSRARVGSHSSDEASRPEPPPKPTSKFRSMLGMSNKSSKKDREAAAQAHLDSQPHSAHHNDRRADEMTSERLTESLAVLRDMGFRDEKKNKTILKGLNGNLQKTIDTLVRLGESSGPSSRSRSPVPSRAISNTAGISVDQSRERDNGPSNNPWAISDTVPPRTAQSTGNVAPRNTQATNPFDALDAPPSHAFNLQPSQSNTGLNQQYQLADHFQHLAVGSQQPLFPNRTGGVSNVVPIHGAPTNSMAPVAQDQFEAFRQPLPTQNFNPFMQSQFQPQSQAQQLSHTSNPYAPTQRSATFPFAQQQQQQQQDQSFQQHADPYGFQQHQLNSQPQTSNPFGYTSPGSQQQTLINSNNPFGAPQQQFQQYAVPQQQQQQTNPWAAQAAQQPSYQQYNSPQAQSHPPAIIPQKTGFNKNDILALYNSPNVAPTPYMTDTTQSPAEIDAPSYFQAESQTQAAPPPSQQGYISQQAPQQQQQAYTTQAPQPQQRSVSTPLSGYPSTNKSTNPFLSNMNASAVQSNGHSHFSRESVLVNAGGWGIQNGRHSPDAFASLSARSG